MTKRTLKHILERTQTFVVNKTNPYLRKPPHGFEFSWDGSNSGALSARKITESVFLPQRPSSFIKRLF